MIRHLLLIISILITQISVGQTHNDYSIQWFNTENGLPANGIKGLQWDSTTQLLWIATEAGIVRYNGVDLLTFTQKNTSAVSSERINFMVKNQLGDIFISDYNGNAITIKGATPYIYHPIQSKSNINDHCLYGLQVSPTFYTNKLKNPIVEPIYLPFDQLANIDTLRTIILHENKLWLSESTNSKIVPIDTKEIHIDNIFKLENEIYILTRDRKILPLNSKMQIGKPASINWNQSIIGTQLPINGYLLWETGSHAPIYIAGKNAWELQYKNGVVTNFQIISNLPQEGYIKYIQHIEEFDMIVVGTDSKGIAVLKRKKIIPVKLNNIPIQQRTAYYNQLELSDGSILTNQGHILGGDQNSNILSPIKGSFGTSLYISSDSTLWYQQYNSKKQISTIHSFNYKSKKKIEHSLPISGNNFGIWESNNKLYIVTNNVIEQYFPERNVLFTIPQTQQAKGDPISVLPIDKERVAIASCNGLVFFNTINSKIDTLLKLPNNCVRSLLKYKDYILIGTYGNGSYIYKLGEKLSKIPLDKKRSLLYTHCFLLDSLGYCWISTNRGLLKTRIDNLVDSYQDAKREVYYRYYGIQDGMVTSEMNGGCFPCAIKLWNGMLSFPTMDGLVWVNPYSNKEINQKGNIYIDEIVVNNAQKSNLTSFPAILRATTKKISISLTYPAWSNVENIYIYYRLTPNEPWQELPYNSPSYLEINNLDPGDYQLEIKKLNGFGKQDFSLLTIPFKIDKPWYNKWWFYLISLTALYGLVLVFLKIQTYRLQKSEQKLRKVVDENTAALKQQYEKMEKNNRIMSRLISIINHDIITPLKFIHVAGKNLLNRKSEVSAEINQETIAEITNTALELQDLSTNILNWIRYQQKNKLLKKSTFKPFETAEQVARVLRSSAKIKQLELKISISPDTAIHQYVEPFRILLHNLVSNAIHFTEHGQIEIGMAEHEMQKIVWVKDTGVGMNKRQVENILKGETIISSTSVDLRKGHGLGYQIIKDLIELMEAEIEINSQKGKGTTVQIYFN